jgi:hypothetical protein
MFQTLKRSIAIILIISVPGIIGALMNAPVPAHAQQSVSKVPNCVVNFRFTAAGSTGSTAANSPYFDNRGRGCTSWVLRYSSSGFSAISIQWDQAPDANATPGSFTTFAGTTSATLPVTSTTFTQVYGYGYAPWVRVTLNSKTGTGVVTGELDGYSGINDLSPVTVIPWASGTLVTGVVTTAMTNTASNQVIAGAASNYLYITSCHASNDHASTDTLMLLQNGSGGSTIGKFMVPHGGGNDLNWPTPIAVSTAGNGLFAANVTTASSTYIECTGFKSTTQYF